VTATPLEDTIRELAGSAEALAAVGAALRLRLGHERADPAVMGALDDVIDALGLREAVESKPAAELEAALAPIRALAVQATDLLNDPWRAPGWSYTDIDLLESQGRTSATFAAIFESAVAPGLAGLSERLAAPGAVFLDVGVGVAGLAVAMCRTWPELRVIGIDPWEPALELARRNAASAGLSDRIELRHQRLEDLADSDSVDLCWLAAPFLPRSALAAGLQRVAEALRPGGWAVIGTYRGGDDLASALAKLRTARSGGATLSAAQAEALLGAAGLADVATFAVDPGIKTLLIAARRPL
jgi:SAM-dependent methyltransferase